MLKILIVDDSMYQRTIIEAALTEYGNCTQAKDGKEAVEKYREEFEKGEPFDLVVMDILMPVMDGHEALKKINEYQKENGVDEEKMSNAIMLSSLDDPQNMMKAQFETGAQVYVTKPFEEDVLVETLMSLDLIDNPVEAD